MGLTVKKAWVFLLDLLFPPRCAACDEVVPIGRDLCPACQEIFTGRDYKLFCISCKEEAHLCDCGEERGALCAAPFVYDNKIRELILALKFEGRRSLSASFAGAMADSARMLDYGKIDVVCDVPLSKQRLRKRGFNQSEDLARELAEEVGAPYQPLLTKPIDNQAQHLLSAKERKKNVQGVYAILDERKVRGQSILLCDDILTTGSTLSECVKELKEAGAAQVFCVTAAATPPYPPHSDDREKEEFMECP